jgi:hypothetical protein
VGNHSEILAAPALEARFETLVRVSQYDFGSANRNGEIEQTDMASLTHERW